MPNRVVLRHRLCGGIRAVLATCAWIGLAACVATHEAPGFASARAGPEIAAFALQLRIASSEYYVTYQRFPRSLKEIDNPPLPASVKAVHFDAGTRAIEIDLARWALAGERVFLVLNPTARLRWRCVSPDIENIDARLPGCVYVAGFVPTLEQRIDTEALVAQALAPRIWSEPPPSSPDALSAAPSAESALPEPPPGPKPEPPKYEHWGGLYEGTLAGLKIVADLYQVEATASGTRDRRIPIAGRYYYRAHPSLMILEASASGVLLECPDRASIDDGCPNPTGIWKVEVDDDRVAGTWQASATAPSKIVELKRRSTQSRPPPDVFSALLHDDKPRAVARAAKRHGVIWKTTRQGSGFESRTLSIVLLRSPVRAARERINEWLLANIRPPDTEGECEETGSCDEGWDVDVLFANERWFSIGGSSYWSGGAHPSNGYTAHTFDLRTGREVDWREILRINDPSAKRNTPLDLDRRDLLAAHVVRAAMAMHDSCVDQLPRYLGCTDNRCDRGPTVEDYYWTTYPTPEGLAVAPDEYDEASRGCRGETVILPWKDVRETFLKPIAMP